MKRRKLSGKAGIGLFVLAALLLPALCLAVWKAGTGTQVIPVENAARILTISRIQKSGGPVMQTALSGEEISEELSAALLEVLAGYSMTARPVRAPQTMAIRDTYDDISIWLENADRSTFRVNVSSVDAYSNVKYGEKSFGITDPASLLRELDALLADSGMRPLKSG